jgi:hypothetical protein
LFVSHGLRRGLHSFAASRLFGVLHRDERFGLLCRD